ncbi:hypothetical protein BGY98DRAFT_1098498 [Russula aff. rugulosa BPL654]|nr:hypothetical protein BGY98DRAFT_1098498 [Russula aff. rugulosa BPL654]
MDPSSTSESPIPPHDTVPGLSRYIRQNDLAPQSLAGFPGGVQGSEVNELEGPPSHAAHPYTHPHAMAESAPLLIPGYVPNIPHRQGGQSCHQPVSLPGEVHGPSTPTELPPTIIPDVLPSYVQSHTPPTVQTSPQWANKEHDIEPDVGPGTERDHVESDSPEASTRPSKKRKDMLRKRDQRAEDRQHFASICELLEIPLTPKKTLSHRILVGVEELVKQRKLDDALRCRLEAGEIDLAALRGELAQDSNDTTVAR